LEAVLQENTFELQFSEIEDKVQVPDCCLPDELFLLLLYNDPFIPQNAFILQTIRAYFNIAMLAFQ
jgi:hypothetical protein